MQIARLRTICWLAGRPAGLLRRAASLAAATGVAAGCELESESERQLNEHGERRNEIHAARKWAAAKQRASLASTKSFSAAALTLWLTNADCPSTLRSSKTRERVAAHFAPQILRFRLLLLLLFVKFVCLLELSCCFAEPADLCGQSASRAGLAGCHTGRPQRSPPRRQICATSGCFCFRRLCRPVGRPASDNGDGPSLADWQQGARWLRRTGNSYLGAH